MTWSYYSEVYYFEVSIKIESASHSALRVCCRENIIDFDEPIDPGAPFRGFLKAILF